MQHRTNGNSSTRSAFPQLTTVLGGLFHDQELAAHFNGANHRQSFVAPSGTPRSKFNNYLLISAQNKNMSLERIKKMIRDFSFRNAWSFEDEQLISFEIGKSPSKDKRFFETPRGDRLSSAMAIMGPNASGKTNVLKALSFVRWFSLFSWNQLEAKENITFDRFQFSKNPEKESAFSLTTETVSGAKYHYNIVLTQKSVVEENLYTMDTKSSRWTYIFKRTRDKNGVETIKLKNINIKRIAIEPQLRGNASLVSIIRKYEDTGLESYIGTIIDFDYNVAPHGRVAEDNALIELEDMRRLCNDTQFMDTISHYIRKFDTGINTISAKKISKKDLQKLVKQIEALPSADPDLLDSVKHISDGEGYIPYTTHTVDGNDYDFPLQLESDGTRQLLKILFRVFTTLEKGGLLIYDELELGLHPHILPEILKLFFSASTNTHHAQIIFTTHYVEMMNELHKSQIILTQKDERCRSHAWRIDEIKGIRPDENLLVKYHSGAYGAVPIL